MASPTTGSEETETEAGADVDNVVEQTSSCFGCSPVDAGVQVTSAVDVEVVGDDFVNSDAEGRDGRTLAGLKKASMVSVV